MKYFRSLIVLLALLGAFPISAASELEVSGWIPYWTSGAPRHAQKQLDYLTTIHPFGYAVKNDGSLSDLMNISKRPWSTLIRAARRDDVLVIPTVMWSDSQRMHEVLSDEDLREEHVEAIGEVVRKGKYDGIDIDYEGKYARTRESFSLFLKELKKEIGRKILSCTIEARTPPESLYRVIPENLEYANDYEMINRYCDRVNIMTYDQQRADLALNDKRKGAPYIPLADAEWVRKVAEFALESFPANKLYLGVATYGHEYEVVTAPQQYLQYNRVGAYNIPAILKKAEKYGIKPERNSAGEMGFSYSSIMSFAPQFRMVPSIPAGTPLSNIIGAWSLDYSNKTGNPAIFNYVIWSDAEAIEQKIAIARDLGLKGIAIFKIDGDEDSKLWELLDKR